MFLFLLLTSSYKQEKEHLLAQVEQFYADRIEYAYTPEGKQLYNEQNLQSL